MPNTATLSPSPLTARLLEQLDSLRDKIRWSDMREALQQANFAPGNGWDAIKGKLTTFTPTEIADVRRVLDGLSSDIVFAGTKEVFVVNLEDADVSAIVQELSHVSVPSNIYSDRFPLALGVNELNGLGEAYEIAGKVDRTNGDISVVLAARRTQEERDRFGYSSVSSVVQHAFRGVDEFITIKRSPYQVSDVFTFRPRLKRFEVLIDHPSRIHKPEFADERFIRILQTLSQSVQQLTRFYENNAPSNLYPAINGLYSDRREGRVTKLSCRLPTGPIVRQAMTSDEDLRNETFHAAGVAAVGTITPNQITVVWDSIVNAPGSLEISVAAPVHALSVVGAYVRSARLTGIRSDGAIAVAVNKIVSYL